jgi:hypothetical protein
MPSRRPEIPGRHQNDSQYYNPCTTLLEFLPGAPRFFADNRSRYMLLYFKSRILNRGSAALRSN